MQVNGKLRAQMELEADVSEDSAIEAAKMQANVTRFLEGQTLRRAIFVRGRMVNLVVG